MMYRLLLCSLLILGLFACNRKSKGYSKSDENTYTIGSKDGSVPTASEINTMLANISGFRPKDKQVVVEFESGTYLVDRSIMLPSGIVLRGLGDVLFERSDARPFHVFQIVNAKNVTIDGISVRGIRANMRSLPRENNMYNYAILAKACRNLVMRNVNIFETINTGVRISGCTHVVFDSCKISNIGFSTKLDNPRKQKYAYDGIKITSLKGNPSKDIDIRNCDFSDIGNYDIDDDGDGIQFSMQDAADDVKIENCSFENCSRRAIKIQAGSNYVIRNNKIRRSRRAIGVTMSHDVSNVLVENNDIQYCAQGFQTNSTSKNVLRGVQIRGNTFSNLSNFIHTTGSSKIGGYRGGDGTAKAKWSIIENNQISSIKDMVLLATMEDVLIKDNSFGKLALKGYRSKYVSKPFTLRKESKNVVFENNSYIGGLTSKNVVDKRTAKKIVIKN